jgi:PAS domain S-box-containing protein
VSKAPRARVAHDRMTPSELACLLRDLELHQVELETQNLELREAKALLEESRNRLADLYDFAPIVYMTLDARGKILEANLTTVALFGIERGALIGKSLTSMAVDADQPALRAHIRRCLGERIRVESELTFSVRNRRPVTAQVVSVPFIAPDGSVTGCKTTLTDITAHKQTQEQLQLLARAGTKLTSSFDHRTTLAEVAHMTVPTLADVSLVDLLEEDGSLRRLEVACGDPAIVRRLAPLRHASPRSDAASAAAYVMQRQQPVLLAECTPESLASTAQGFEHDVLVKASGAQSLMILPLVSRGKALGVMTFMMVDSGRRCTPALLNTARQLAAHAATAIENARLFEAAQRAIRARDDLLTFVSHDLRNPLTGIHLTTELLLRGAPGEERRKGWAQLDRVRRSVVQMQRMIDDLLDVASVDAGRLKFEVGVHDAALLCVEAVSALAPLATDKGIVLRCDVPDDLGGVRCDRERVLQVLSNLLGNALKFTPAKGSVTLTAGRTAELVTFTVKDTGAGIPASLRDHVFERFWQAEPSARKGRGLGLYIAKGLVQAQGGALWVESPPEGGAWFSFTLPRASYCEAARREPATMRLDGPG